MALGSLDGFNTSRATAVDSTGSVVVGFAKNAETGATDAFQWTQGQMTSLGIVRYGDSRALGVSGDGSIVVGDMVKEGRVGFRWTSTGLSELEPLDGNQGSSAVAISGDGKVIVGSSTDGSLQPSYSKAVLWAENGDVTSLGTLSGSEYSAATAVNSDGTVVVGYSKVFDPTFTAFDLFTDRAFIWRAGKDGDGQIQDLANLMASFPALAGDTELAFAAQQAGVDNLMDSRGMARGAGQSFVSLFSGVLNTGSGDDIGAQSASLGGISYGYGVSDQLTLGFSIAANGTNLSGSGFDLDNGSGAAAWGEYSQNSANRTGWQGSFALGTISQNAALARGRGFVDVEVATGASALTTRSARLELGYGFAHSSGWVLTPTVGIAQNGSTRSAGAENPDATAFSAAYDRLEASSTIGTLGMTGDWQIADDRSLSLGAGVDFDLDVNAVTLTGAANIPGMDAFAVDSPLSRADVRPYATASYSMDVTKEGTFTASVRAGRATYGDVPELGLGLRYAINF
jgi:probable HAF family extracellular repeat protein